MKRQRALLVFALGSLRRRLGRQLALGLALGLVVGAYASVLWLTDGLRAEWRAAIEGTPDLVVQRLVAGRPGLIDADADVVPAGPGVRSVRPRVWGYVFVEAIAANATVVGTTWRSVPPTLLEGRDLSADPTDVPQALLGAGLAERFAVHVGDRIALPDPEHDVVVLEIVGIFRTESALQSNDVLYTTDAVARRLLGVPEGQATDLAVELARPEEAAVVAAQIQVRLSGARVLERTALVRTYELTFDGRGGLLGALLLPVLLALLLIGWERFTGLSPAERREIGVLKTIGWETRDVLAARLWESLLLCLGATWFGVVLAYGYVFVLNAPGLSGALFGWSALHPPLELRPTLDPAALAMLFGIVVVPFLGLSIVPAWRAATLDPSEAMR
jgi:ABC-type lipoprotein release transport system permease subunit